MKILLPASVFRFPLNDCIILWQLDAKQQLDDERKIAKIMATFYHDER